MNSGSFLAPFWPPFGAMALFGHPFGDVLGLFWLAFSAFARLEPPGKPFQHHFDDWVSFLVPLLRVLKVTFAENAHTYWRSFGSFFFSIFSVRVCERSEAERGRCVVEAAWLNTTWDLPVLCNIAAQLCFPFSGSSGFY